MSNVVIGRLLCIVFTLLLAGQIAGIVKMIKSRRTAAARKSFMLLCAAECACIALAALSARYFDTAEGYGMMPGLTWLFHWFVSTAAAVLYAILLAATLLLRLLLMRKR